MLSSTHSHIQNLTAVQDSLTPPSMGDLGERVLQPMKWGLVPNWRRTDQTRTPLLNNCRLEGILEKPSFRNAVERRRRCVVLADGWVWLISGRDYHCGCVICLLNLLASLSGTDREDRSGHISSTSGKTNPPLKWRHWRQSRKKKRMVCQRIPRWKATSLMVGC